MLILYFLCFCAAVVQCGPATMHALYGSILSYNYPGTNFSTLDPCTFETQTLSQLDGIIFSAGSSRLLDYYMFFFLLGDCNVYLPKESGLSNCGFLDLLPVRMDMNTLDIIYLNATTVTQDDQFGGVYPMTTDSVLVWYTVDTKAGDTSTVLSQGSFAQQTLQTLATFPNMRVASGGLASSGPGDYDAASGVVVMSVWDSNEAAFVLTYNVKTEVSATVMLPKEILAVSAVAFDTGTGLFWLLASMRAVGQIPCMYTLAPGAKSVTQVGCIQSLKGYDFPIGCMTAVNDGVFYALLGTGFSPNPILTSIHLKDLSLACAPVPSPYNQPQTLFFF